MTFSSETEPPGSASSSPDEHQCCPHYEPELDADACCVCGTREALDAAAPAEPEPGTCIRPSGCSYLFTIDCEHGCRAAADDLTRMAQEMRHEHDWGDWGAGYCGGHLVWRRCSTCHVTESRSEGHYCPECTPDMPAGPEGPREPPIRAAYVIEYALTDGRHYEVALPGDAEIRVADSGALVITHTERVTALTWVRPGERA